MSLLNPFWFAVKNFIDNFNRTTTNNLGTSSGGQTWTALRGTTASTGWYANGTQGQSDANPTTYPIASYDLGVTDTTSKIDSGPGTGIAFWITDANSWWAAYPFYSTSSNSVCDQSQVTSTNNPPAGNCCSTVTTSSTTTCTGSTVSCTDANNTCAPGGCGTVTSTANYTCTGSTVSCTDGTNTCNPGGCGTVTSTSSTTCTGTTVSCKDRTNTCAPGGCGTVSSSSASVTSYFIEGGGCPPGTTSVNCSNCAGMGTCNGTSFFCCREIYTEYTRTQNTNVTTYTRTQNTSVLSSYTRTQNTNVTTTSYSCYTSYTTTYTYDSAIRIISSVSGTVATDSTTSLATSNSSHPTIASIEVSTSGNTITAKGYSSAGQVTQLGSTVTRTPSSPTKGTSIGIIKAPSDVGQSSTVDNYSVNA